MKSDQIKTITLKGLSLFFYVNGLNLLVVLIALYFSSLFIFNTKEDLFLVLLDYKFHFIILASLFSIASGYIIHYFYEEELQQIKKPFRGYLQQFISKNEYLNLYIFLNTISLILALFVSVKMMIFFIIYQFFMWFYSHKLSTIIMLNNMSKSILTLLPFLALMWYFNSFSLINMLFGLVLFIALLLKEVLKDITTVQSDKIFNHKTIANTFGIEKSKIYIIFLVFLSLILNGILIYYFALGVMELYLIAGIFVYLFIIMLIYTTYTYKFIFALQLTRIWIVTGIFCIPFIDWNIFKMILS